MCLGDKINDSYILRIVYKVLDACMLFCSLEFRIRVFCIFDPHECHMGLRNASCMSVRPHCVAKALTLDININF